LAYRWMQLCGKQNDNDQSHIAMQEQDRIWTLVARKLAGESTREERKELEQLLHKYPEMTYTVEMLLNIWAQETPPENEEAEEAFERLMQRMAVKEAQKITRQPPASIAGRVTWKKRPSKANRLLNSFMNSGDMLNNYLKTSCRTLLRNKTFSAINIIGLAIGMAGAILLLLWIQNIYSFDQFHAKKDRIYQVFNRDRSAGQIEVWGATSQPIGPALKARWPQVEEAVRMNWVGAFILKKGDTQLQTQGFLTDPGFFSLFDFPFLKGDPHTALNSPHSIVLTEKTAARLFGKEEPMGKVIRIDSNINFTITGILKQLPNNTRFDFDYLMPWSYMKEVGWESGDWINSSIATYVLLKPGVTEAKANTLIGDLVKKNTNASTELFLHPMAKWQLWSRFENGKIVGGGIDIVRLFGIIAAFILLIACINYMNMSTARSEKRAKEVGIRKVAGAGRHSLIFQFISESMIIALVAGILALIIAQSVLGWFNSLTDVAITIPYHHTGFWLAAFGFILITGMLAGSYPAFYLSAFRPVKVLKGTFKAVHAMVTPRKVLVVVQFTFAIIFIICTVIIYRQILHVQHRDVGINMDKLAFVYVKGDMSKNYRLIKNELLNSGLATSVTRTNSPVTDVWSNTDRYTWEGKDPQVRMGFVQFLSDDDFTQTMGLKVLAGRDINTNLYPTDSTAMLLTESAVKQMGLQQPLGKVIKGEYRNWHVVGVISDFIPGSPFQPVAPIILQGPDKDWFGAISFRLKGETPDDLEKVAQVFKKYNPDYPFEYHFTKEAHTNKFRGQQSTGELAAVFAGLTILISCMGLFALATYMAESRIKEVGVRKVLGASVSAIVALLSTGFLKLVFIAFLVASPLAWWMMHSWLQHFAYRIDIGWWVFGLTGLVSVFIAVATISYQALKAALSNPVKALRSE
jgi:putative ABC transport system permease protein